jgi:hypothetical protein
MSDNIINFGAAKDAKALDDARDYIQECLIAGEPAGEVRVTVACAIVTDFDRRVPYTDWARVDRLIAQMKENGCCVDRKDFGLD